MVRNILAGQPVKRAALNAGVSQTTAHKWLKRYKVGGREALSDRSSRPDKLYNPTPKDIIKQIITYRKQHLTGKHIAKLVGVSRATISRALRRARLSRARDLEPKEPVRRYERETPGELIHLRYQETKPVLAARTPGNGHPSRKICWCRLGLCPCTRGRLRTLRR